MQLNPNTHNYLAHPGLPRILHSFRLPKILISKDFSGPGAKWLSLCTNRTLLVSFHTGAPATLRTGYISTVAARER